MTEAIQLFTRTEGILLYPVYTGKEAAGLIDLIRPRKAHEGPGSALRAHLDTWLAF